MEQEIVQQEPPELLEEIHLRPNPKDTDYWIVYNYCDHCEQTITKEQYEEGDSIIRVHMNSFNDMVFFGMHRKCFIWHDSLFDEPLRKLFDKSSENVI